MVSPRRSAPSSVRRMAPGVVDRAGGLDRQPGGRPRPVEIRHRAAFGEAGGDDGRVLAHADRLGFLDAGGKLGMGRGRLQLAGQHADGGEIGLARDLEGALGIDEVGARGGEPGLGLADVGAGDLADLEAVVGGVELFAQHAHVVPGDADEFLRLDHVHIGGDRGEEHFLLDVQQAGAARRDAVARGFERGLGLAVVEEKERGLQFRGVDVVDGKVVDRGRPGRPRGGGDLGPARRARLGHVLVQRAQRGAVGIEQRAGLVGLDQRVGQRLRGDRPPGHHGHGSEQDPREFSCHCHASTSLGRTRRPLGQYRRQAVKIQTLSPWRNRAVSAPWRRRYAARRSRSRS